MSDSPTPAPSRALLTTLAALQNECTGVDTLIDDLFSELDRVRRQLAAKAIQIARAEDQSRQQKDDLQQSSLRVTELERALAQRSEELDRQRQEATQYQNLLEQAQTRKEDLEAWQNEWREKWEQIGSAAASVPDTSHVDIQAWQHQFDGLASQLETLKARPDWLADLEQRLEQLSAQAESAGEHDDSGPSEEFRNKLDSAINELAGLGEVTREITQMRELVNQAIASGSSGATGGDLAALQEQLRSVVEEMAPLRQQYEEVSRERDQLESELELTRGRAVELQDQVDSQAEELEVARSSFDKQLAELRHAIDQQGSSILNELHSSGSRSHSAPAAPVNVTAAAPGTNSNPPEGSDHVVSSVMEQFAKLQKDVAQRRKRRS